MRLVLQHRHENLGIQRIPRYGQKTESEEEDHVEDEEGRADGAEGGMGVRPWQVEQEGIDDASALSTYACAEVVAKRAIISRVEKVSADTKQPRARRAGRTIVTEYHEAVLGVRERGEQPSAAGRSRSSGCALTNRNALSLIPRALSANSGWWPMLPLDTSVSTLPFSVGAAVLCEETRVAAADSGARVTARWGAAGSCGWL